MSGLDFFLSVLRSLVSSLLTCTTLSLDFVGFSFSEIILDICGLIFVPSYNNNNNIIIFILT